MKMELKVKRIEEQEEELKDDKSVSPTAERISNFMRCK
jgi:hypothetical protein